MRTIIFIFLLCCTQSSFPKILEIPDNWKVIIKSEQPILPYKLARIMNVTEDQGLPQATDKAITETTAYFAYLRKVTLDSNFFDVTSNRTVDLFYNIESYELDRASKILDNVEKLRVRYQVKTSDGTILFDQVVESVGVYDFASNKESKSWRANAQKFLILFRTQWDDNFLLIGEKLWQAAEKDALNPNRTVGSSILTGAGATVLAVGGVVVAGGGVVKDTLSAAGDILSDPAFSNAIQQQTASMQRELDRQQRQEIEAKAYSAQKALERSKANASSSASGSSSSSSNYSASSSSKSSGSSSSSSSGNTNIGATNKKYQTEREKNLKAQEQKKLEQQKAYEAKLAKEQKEREEEERQREIQLANEKREKDRQAEKERQQREQLAKKQREEQERNNYLTNVKNSLRLKAVNCYGNNFAVGQIPKGLGLSKHGAINVNYRAYCPGGGSYSGVSKNFIGMIAGCLGDTNSHDGGLIPKEVLSCKASEMTVDVTNVTFTR